MGGSAVNFQTPTPLYEAENQIFGSLPWANTGGAMYNAYNSIGNLSNPNDVGNITALQGNTGTNLLNQVPGALSSGQGIYNSTIGAGNTVLNNMFNNQQGYYNQLQQQNQDQANAENAMAGVATTPYGAALANQSNLNFNNQWQSFLNSQQSTAANTANSLYNTGMGALSSGVNNASNLANTGNSLASVPFNAQQQQYQDYLNYLLGNTQNSAAYTNAVNQSTSAGAASTSSLAQAQQASNSGKSGIGGALGGIGSLVGGLL